jgi:uncharacterized membrane protein required for colicin V production
MSLLDSIIVLILGLGAAFGAVSGAFWQVARIVMCGLAACGSLRWGSWASGVLAHRFSEAPSAVFGYALVFLFVWLGAYAACCAIDRGLKLSDLKWLDRILGGALGAAKAAAIVLVLLAGLAMYPTPEFAADLRESVLAPAMLGAAEKALPVDARARARTLLDEANRRMEPLYGDATDAPRAFARAVAPEK